MDGLRERVRLLLAGEPGHVWAALSALYVVVYTLMFLAEWTAWGGWTAAAAAVRSRALAEALTIAVVNVVYGLLIIAVAYLVRPTRWSWKAAYGRLAAVAFLLSFPRVMAMYEIRSAPTGVQFLAAEWFAGFAAGFVAVSSGLLTAQLLNRARAEERRAARAVTELQAEEIRVRRTVSDQLHGTLQHRLVTVTAGLDALTMRLVEAGDRANASTLHGWAEELEEIREADVRALSHAVYPSGVELGAMRAIDVMLRRLPRQVSASLDVGPAYRRFLESDEPPLPLTDRLVVVDTVEEGLTNALKHGHATTLRVRAEIAPVAGPDGDRWRLDLTVDDDGTGPGDAAPELRGLARQADRLAARGGTLALGSNEDGGGRLRLTLPFVRQRGGEPVGLAPAEDA